MRKTGRLNIFFVSLLIILLLVGYSFTPLPHLDLSRYYEYVDDLGNSTPREVAEYFHKIKFDFLYFYSLSFFKNSFLGMSFLTGLINMTFYYLILKDADAFLLKHSKQYVVLILGLFCFPNFIWVLELSRTAMAVCFFFMGVLLWLKGKRLVPLLFFALSFITHTTSVMLSFVFILSYYLYIFYFYKKNRIVNILCYILPFIMAILLGGVFGSIISNPLLELVVGDSAYQGYLGGSGADVNGFAYAEYGTVAIMLAEMVSVYLLLNVCKQNSLERFLLLIFGSLTIGFCFASVNFYKRFALCFSIFYVLYFLYLYKTQILEKTRLSLNVLRVMTFNSLFCIFSFLLEFYAYRFWTLL